MTDIHRWWSPHSPASPTSLWHRPDIIDWDFDVTRLPYYQPHRVHPSRELQHQANIARLHLLYELGGWWVDHDARINVPLDQLPFPMTASHNPRLRCNCVMGFPAGHPLLRAALTIIASAPPSTRPATEVSGERLLTRLLPDSIAALTYGRWLTHRQDTSGSTIPAWQQIPPSAPQRGGSERTSTVAERVGCTPSGGT